jgi:hypothetical protein
VNRLDLQTLGGSQPIILKNPPDHCQGQTQRFPTASQGHFTPKIRENRELVTDDPVEFER